MQVKPQTSPDTYARDGASIPRLSNLRTLCLSSLWLDDISITGKLFNLEILSIRDSQLEEKVNVLSRPEPTPWAGPALGDHCWPQANPWPGFLNSAET
ncbi:hypothetical protein MTR67_046215 [Solanum verrucosum]|uniref:Uncharacterized protein n=1 Tax=Solanum verrucosum TaxID=315347 RepID=A0AAF0UVH5_SOLVR|nr:hypothetical protein MTR67_046215 [Solanum verrucosum]